ncbi:hypothetical protein DYL61_15310 [Pseudomonas nabeulensis]|uniref:RING-type E3 ubiquitin transferase n=1 Tax=Pseudomonas nabeulensis TaxID=2293833 RepID=A0A4Z0B383_9PSED|nr:NEL-type E3 ubiquitin ligase domain-containing protein [Pseudomonas nabeulensis]TFY93181.1 hypothetical protein DYL61_15310 [Pseudomonas nabeulensis]
MTLTPDLIDATPSVTADELDTALLDLSGDLDKARVLRRTLAPWMIKAKLQTLQALKHAHIDSEELRRRAKARLARLQPLDKFCAALLKDFLAAKGFASLDIERDTLELPRRKLSGVSPDLGGGLIQTVTVTKYSLLQAAMQNFTQAQAEGSLSIAALIRSHATQQPISDLSALAFVGYCRELDLGEAYQRHVVDVMGVLPKDDDGHAGMSFNPAAADIGQSRCQDMQIDLHIALGKGHISEATYSRLLGLIRINRPAKESERFFPLEKPWIWQGVNLLGACLWGVLVISDDVPGQLVADPVVVYMPNEPNRPWYEYASLADFLLYLTLNLQVASYRAFFKGYLDESQCLSFFTKIDAPGSVARLEAMPVVLCFEHFFFSACLGKIQMDAQVLAVPKAQVDDDASERRWLAYMDVGLDVLNIAAFVVPVIGQLMMGVAVGQLLGEIFEGVEDWSHGDKTEALGHLINVAENIATMALFAAGGRVVGSLKPSTMSSTHFFDKFEAVSQAPERLRLWRPRLFRYRQPNVLSEHAVANAQGVYQANGRSYIKMDGDLYWISYEPGQGQWRINHPTRATAYRPALVHNHQGGWQHVYEQTERWRDIHYQLSRLDPRLATLPHEQLDGVASITGVSHDKLNRLSLEHRPLPERFQDAVARLRQDQKIRDLKHYLQRELQPPATTARTQLLALPLMPEWPTGRFFEVLDAKGNLLESYPNMAPFDYEDLSIHITRDQLEAGEVMPTLLQQLSEEERASLVGEVAEGEQPVQALSRRLLLTLKQHHQALHEQLYRDYNGKAVEDLLPLNTRFPHLPNRLGRELLAQASDAQRRHMRGTGRVPLTLAEQARLAADSVEEDKALLGLYVPALATDATRRVTVGLLQHLSGWPGDLRLEVRLQNLRGNLLASVGPTTARLRHTVLKTAAGFQAVDAAGVSLGTEATGVEGFYQAVVDALPADRRTRMNLNSPSAAGILNNQVKMTAQTERRRLAGYLWPERAEPEPLALCALAQLPAVEPPPPALMRKVRKLYPLFTDTQISTFIQEAGADHLARARAVDGLEQTLRTLHRALKTWRKDKSSYTASDAPLWDYRLSRFQVARAIEQSWRRTVLVTNRYGVKVQGLSLQELLRGRLPTLPPQVSFDHVQHLCLKGLKLDDDCAYFLKHFKGLRSLDLAGNALTRLPEVLSQMPNLEHLILAGNRLQLNLYDRSRLADMRGLQSLNLSDNPLIDPPDVSRMFELRELILRDCRLKSFPKEALRLPYLELVDLRQNDIDTLPDGVFKLSRQRAQAYNLRHNPLDARTQRLLQDFRNNVGTGMGFAEDDIPRLNEQRARELWLADDGVERYPEKNLIWAGFKDEPESDSLFKLLGDLGGTADAVQVREDLDRRVWRVLEAGARDSGLRAELFERAATPLNCDDAVANSFSNLEVLVELHEASKRVGSGPGTSKSLLALGKGLFRLDQLESYARKHSDEHPSADPLEVSLAYRTGLADRFHLPGQPRHMRFSRLGGVTGQALAQAAVELRAAEQSPRMSQYLARLPFWISHLKRTASNLFAGVNLPFNQRMETIFEQAETLGDVSYREQMDTVLREQEQAEHTEVVRQTEEALKVDTLEACDLP